MAKTKLKIEGMHCTSCAMDIDMDLEEVSGIKSARTSYARQETEVEFDDQLVDIDKILDTVKTTGYQASINN